MASQNVRESVETLVIQAWQGKSHQMMTLRALETLTPSLSNANRITILNKFGSSHGKGRKKVWILDLSKITQPEEPEGPQMEGQLPLGF